MPIRIASHSRQGRDRRARPLRPGDRASLSTPGSPIVSGHDPQVESGEKFGQPARPEPPPLYGRYNLVIDFSKQTFNGMPTPMNPVTVPTGFSTQCDVNGCLARMDNTDDHTEPRCPHRVRVPMEQRPLGDER
ncbi:Rv2253/PknI dimerization domain-containing protein [[Mycobacterium] appelbergii]